MDVDNIKSFNKIHVNRESFWQNNRKRPDLPRVNWHDLLATVNELKLVASLFSPAKRHPLQPKRYNRLMLLKPANPNATLQQNNQPLTNERFFQTGQLNLPQQVIIKTS